ncbi:hypothetical protein [Paraburkholderia lycopersici]|uniref:DUF4852 domain-containing protein n=1 Tax=Paraburkholderia lycopersici TaxID=416944 RepID=A0A1G7CKP9_9BURK|nr:hypothetical protein [Paraburkholderia lycopersici]SDE39907.1 hypothetical protein SAMN05421548_14614 [Paraburkholderia lycopersici]
MKPSIRTLVAFAALAAITGLSACSKSSDSTQAAAPASAPAANLTDLASPAAQKQIADKSLPNGDASRALADFRTIDSGNEVMFLYYGLSSLPADYDKIAQSYSRDYQTTGDSFRKQDLLKALKPRIDAAIAAAKDSRYVVLNAPGASLDAYDFTRKGFQVTNVAQPGSYQYFFDNSNYTVEYTNGADHTFIKVDDEAAARAIEEMRSHYRPLTVRLYAFAQDADPASNRVKLQILHTQLLDASGRVLVQS